MTAETAGGEDRKMREGAQLREGGGEGGKERVLPYSHGWLHTPLDTSEIQIVVPVFQG